jgi:hypothetical protein
LVSGRSARETMVGDGDTAHRLIKLGVEVVAQELGEVAQGLFERGHGGVEG